jgi:glucose-1-phosphatase
VGKKDLQCRTVAGLPATFGVSTRLVWIVGWKIATLSLVFNVTPVHASSSIPLVPSVPPVVPITTVMFDLGNVLLHFDHRLIGENLARDVPDARLHDARLHADTRWHDLMHEVETGALSDESFLDRFAALLCVDVRVHRTRLVNAWSDIFWRNDGMLPLLDMLRGHMRLVLVSNTNALHLDYIRTRFPEVLAPFDVMVFSHLEHVAKPDAAIFRTALARAGASPASCLYFDDIRMHVHAATELGIHAYHYVSNAGVRDILALHGVPTHAAHARVA